MLSEILEKYKNKKPMDLKTAVERQYPVSAVIDMMAEYAEQKIAEHQKEIKDVPNVETAIHESAKLLIEATKKAGFKNPEIDCKLSVDDGTVYLLKFERVDAG
jgi:uncharacterized protein YfdQ (DUF2303 family)